MRVLLIEDDTAVSASIELMLRSEGIEVCTTKLGDDGILLSRLFYDIIVLDMQLPDMNGFEVLKALRDGKIITPVLILSGDANVETKVKALGVGADDYMTKPFHKEELIARIQSAIRRSKGYSHTFVNSGALIVDLKSHTVEVEGIRKNLTGPETQTLFHALQPFLSPTQMSAYTAVDS